MSTTQAPKQILAATDFSEASDAALSYARDLARAQGAVLHVLHVAGNVVAGAVGVEGYTTDYVALQREVEAGAQKYLDSLVTDEDRRTLNARTAVVTSTAPADAIVRYARDHAIDLVIVGTHGRGGAERFAMGSVAERVVRAAPCPVLTVRGPVREPAPAVARFA